LIAMADEPYPNARGRSGSAGGAADDADLAVGLEPADSTLARSSIPSLRTTAISSSSVTSSRRMFGRIILPASINGVWSARSSVRIPGT
jgi:hypothetical protein